MLSLLELAKIVRGADTQAKDLTPYSRGLEAIAEGFRVISKDDFENTEKAYKEREIVVGRIVSALDGM